MPSRFFDFKTFMVKIISLLNQKLMMVSKLTRIVAVTYKKIQPHLLLGLYLHTRMTKQVKLKGQHTNT